MKIGQAAIGNASSSSWPASETTVPVCPGYGGTPDDIYHTQMSALGIIGFIAIINNIVALCLMLRQKCNQRGNDKEIWTFICLSITDLLLGTLTVLTCLDSLYGRQKMLKSSPGLCLTSIIVVHCLIGRCSMTELKTTWLDDQTHPFL